MNRSVLGTVAGLVCIGWCVHAGVAALVAAQTPPRARALRDVERRLAPIECPGGAFSVFSLMAERRGREPGDADRVVAEPRVAVERYLAELLFAAMGGASQLNTSGQRELTNTVPLGRVYSWAVGITKDSLERFYRRAPACPPRGPCGSRRACPQRT